MTPEQIKALDAVSHEAVAGERHHRRGRTFTWAVAAAGSVGILIAWGVWQTCPAAKLFEW
jgi:hypothetical protein